MSDIKFKYYWSNGKSVISRIFTLDEIENGAPLDYTCDCPLLRSYRRIGRCQFAGSTDVNGVEIYGADIVEVESEELDVRYLSLIYMYRGALCVDIEYGDYGCVVVGCEEEYFSLRVVGNKYDNPELLEKCV